MRCPIFLLAVITGCAGPGTVDFAGKLDPVRGVCDAPSEATLTLRGETIVFAPQAGTLLLTGKQSGPHLDAHLSLRDANKAAYLLAFAGEMSGRTVVGTYTTPRCAYDVKLTQTAD